jgi:hypothetical protein
VPRHQEKPRTGRHYTNPIRRKQTNRKRSVPSVLGAYLRSRPAISLDVNACVLGELYWWQFNTGALGLRAYVCIRGVGLDVAGEEYFAQR